jgi:hypothetical protein
MSIPAITKMRNRDPRTFAMRFDALSTLYGDPLAGLFALAYSSSDPEIKLRAFSELLPYRHPRLKQVEHTGDGRSGPQVVMQINLSPAQAQEALTPAGTTRDTPILSNYTREITPTPSPIVQGEVLADRGGPPSTTGPVSPE